MQVTWGLEGHSRKYRPDRSEYILLQQDTEQEGEESLPHPGGITGSREDTRTVPDAHRPLYINLAHGF
jgi:hypothetical protein